MPKGIYPQRSLKERFWAKIDMKGPDECWEWIGGKNGKGYGVFGVGGKTILAHRMAWEINNGPISKGKGYHGTCVLHYYDKPGCVNPTHLFLGTHVDNMHDMTRKERQAHGEAQGQSRLTEQDIHEIRRSLEIGYSQKAIAHRHGVSRRTIYDIDNGYTWTWLTEGILGV